MDEGGVEDLYEWLDKIPLSKPTGNIARDFSDGVLMAEVLKYYYPRHVELHNYSSACAKSLKKDNWTTLNRKVLSKLGLDITDCMINEITVSVPGAIQQLLESVRSKIMEGERARRTHAEEGSADNISDLSIIPVRSLTGEKVENEKTVPLKVLEKKNRELEAKEEAIAILSHKVSHLETLVKLKDQRITELNAQLQRYQK